MTLTIEVDRTSNATHCFVTCFIDGEEIHDRFSFPMTYDWDGDGVEEETTDDMILDKVKQKLTEKGWTNL